MHRLLISFSLLAGLAACGTDPQTSYCEAICDNASVCHEAERGADVDTVYADCLAATEAADENCAKASNGELNAATAKLLTTCTDDLAADGDCSGYTGTIDEQETATTPASCLTYNTEAQDVYNDARDATSESGEELCERVSDTFCEQVTGCLTDELGDGLQSAIDTLGYSPKDSCLEKVDSQTSTCKTTDLYESGEDVTDSNLVREAARECMTDFSSLTCEELFSGTMPALCAGALTDPTQYAGALLEVATEFRDAQ